MLNHLTRFIVVLSIFSILFWQCGNDDDGDPPPAVPTLVSFTPVEGTEGAVVTIIGTNFSTTTSENVVKFNGTPATVSVASDVSLVATVPAGASTGKITLEVNGRQVESNRDFTVVPKTADAPTITGFSPTSGEAGTSVTITGTNFLPTPGENKVTFNGITAPVGEASATSLSVLVPGGAVTGKISVAVGNQTAVSTTDFEVIPTAPGDPSIIAFIPQNGSPGTTVTINGTNFSPDIAGNTVTFNNVAASVTSASSTSLVVVVPAEATTGNITVRVGDNTATSANAFTVLPASPVIISFTPARGASGAEVVLRGTNFSSTAANNTVEFNGVSSEVISAAPDELTVVVPEGADAGQISVRVGNQVTISDENFTILDTWIESNSFKENVSVRNQMAGFVIGGKGYVVGGSFGSTRYDELFEYDPMTGTWTEKAAFGGGDRFAMAGFVIDDKAYMGLGVSRNGSQSDFWEYDPQADAWTKKNNVSRSFLRSRGLNAAGKGYIQGDRTLLEYDPENDSWSEKALLPGNNARSQTVGVVINDKIYAGFGIASITPLNDFWEYDASADSWTQKASLPGDGFRGAVTFSLGGKGFVATGIRGNTDLSEVWEYDPAQDAWSRKDDFRGGTMNFGVSLVIDDKAYIGIGNRNETFNTLWEYVPDL
ncbi:hypothetical protein FNH22_19100 [Fulvivirga sp. M361]|uniref:IPT/TIG domain-containing protein n=1 Tax=Fulvivirga sp. M361 TaxID=2594266 RepID=UPI00117B6CED|nr:IPT/TIG domain-containing protein [Fulvivirga sp. M361]TRX54863.1 hypothetical protein FNH22_19100 [Fulvivirga sp. M361]